MSSEQNSLDTILQIKFTPMKTALLNEHETSFYVLAEFITGSKPDTYKVDKRPPMALSLVIDRSGSMNGRPLQEAIKCAKYIIEHAHNRIPACTHGELSMNSFVHVCCNVGCSSKILLW